MLKPGGRVKVVANNHKAFGQVGTVVRIAPRTLTEWMVRLDSGDTVRVHVAQVEQITPA